MNSSIENAVFKWSWLIWILFCVTFLGVAYYMKEPPVKEVATAIKVASSSNNFFEKMKIELETTKNGDILETRWIGEWEGTRALLVVTQDSRDGRVYYQVKGGSVMLQSSSELAQRVVKVYRVGTPEWREQTEAFMEQ